jgi:hypothetical protein
MQKELVAHLKTAGGSGTGKVFGSNHYYHLAFYQATARPIRYERFQHLPESRVNDINPGSAFPGGYHTWAPSTLGEIPTVDSYNIGRQLTSTILELPNRLLARAPMDYGRKMNVGHLS